MAAAKVLRSYADNFELEEQKFLNESKKFEELACQVLNICADKKHQDKINALLLGKIKVFESSSPLEMAIAAHADDFIFQDSCKNLFNHSWYGHIQEDTSKIKVYILRLL